jgi:O-glycosyl hydrolase
LEPNRRADEERRRLPDRRHVAGVGALLAGCSGSSGGGVTANATVAINPARQFQRIAGFGVSEGFGQAKTLKDAPVSVQQQVLSLLYSPTRGAGLTILRNEISPHRGFTIEPRAPSSPNAKPSYLTLAEVDQDQGQLWFAKQIKADYGVSDVFADAWSAPAFMKSNDSPVDGGTLCGAPGASCRSGDWRRAYAGYLTDTTHQLSAQTPITVRNSAFTATLPPRSLVTYDIRS